MIVVDFPVDPHVKKYLIKKVGPELNLSKKSVYSQMIRDILSQNHFASKPSKRKPTAYKVVIPDYIVLDWNNAMALDKKTYQEFNARVDTLFRHDLITYCEMFIDSFKIVDIIRRFYDYYDLSPDDINEESLARFLRRKGIVKKKIKNGQKNNREFCPVKNR